MTIIPAIDLKDGFAVRLTKGEMNTAKIYGEAVKFAKKFESMGAKWLHIVDLNGALAGSPKNLKIIEDIRKNCNLNIELGGGIRDEFTIKMYLNLGINRIILGSLALKRPDFAKELAAKYPIALGIDAKDGFVSSDGWAQDSKINALDFAKQFKNSKFEAIICTDISKDGTLEGLNIDFCTQIFDNSGISTIASGGFSSMDDFYNIQKNEKISGIIVGKAFYENRIDLKKLLKITQ